jgi:hypothetical protein
MLIVLSASLPKTQKPFVRERLFAIGDHMGLRSLLSDWFGIGHINDVPADQPTTTRSSLGAEGNARVGARILHWNRAQSWA